VPDAPIDQIKKLLAKSRLARRSVVQLRVRRSSARCRFLFGCVFSLREMPDYGPMCFRLGALGPFWQSLCGKLSIKIGSGSFGDRIKVFLCDHSWYCRWVAWDIVLSGSAAWRIRLVIHAYGDGEKSAPLTAPPLEILDLSTRFRSQWCSDLVAPLFESRRSVEGSPSDLEDHSYSGALCRSCEAVRFLLFQTLAWAIWRPPAFPCSRMTPSGSGHKFGARGAPIYDPPPAGTVSEFILWVVVATSAPGLKRDRS
jgi:hypothetical protein